MVSITKFKTEYNKYERVYYVVPLESAICPVCSSALSQKGRAKRKVTMTDGEKRVMKVRRLKCVSCKTSHRELPDIIVPYKRHCAETIEGIINVGGSTAYCESSTINRIKAWWAAMQLYIESVLKAIKERHGIDLAAAKKLAEIVRSLTNTHFWPGTRSALAPGRK